MHQPLGEILKVGPSQTVAALLIYTSLPNGQKLEQRLEQELPKWVGLDHENILPLYGMTGIKDRLYLVSGSSRMGQREVDSSPLGITALRKWKPEHLRQGNPPSE